MAFNFYAIKLSGFMVLVFLLQLFIDGFTDFLILDQSSYFQIWRFLTAIFLHGGLPHLIYNLFALIFFGSVLEKLIGGRKFLYVFFITGIFANLIAVNFYSASLGASGAIFGIIGALVIVRPLLPIFAFGIPMPMFIAGLIWAVGDLLGAYGFLTGNPISNTGNIAHLSGMLLGIFMGSFYRERRTRKKRSHEIDEGIVRKWEDYFMRDI